MLEINQEQLRKLGVIILGVVAVYALPWTRSILSILDKPIVGTIAGIHIIALASLYFTHRVWYRNL